LAAGTSRSLERLQRAASAAAVAAALGMLAWRFANFDLVPFINDEPIFLQAARDQLVTGHWRQASPIPGTQGFTYGPSVMWFYALVQLAFGFNPAVCIAAMCALVSAAHVWLCAALARALEGGPLLFATLLALLASSPYQFFWSRLAWDQLVNVLAAVAVALVATRARFSLVRCAALGLALGFALSSHLMVAPFVLMLGAVLAVEWLRTPVDLLKRAAVTAAAAAVVSVPYALFLVRQPWPRSPPPESGAGLFERMLEIPRVSTAWKLDYFFDADWPAFISTLPQWVQAALPSLTVASMVVCAGVALAGVGALIASGNALGRRLGALALLTAIAYPSVYAFKGLMAHPHYQFPVYWVVVVGVAGALAALRSRPRLALALGALVWVVALGQLAFVQRWMSFIRAEGGTQGRHYATPLAAQQSVMRRACAAPQRALTVVNETNLYSHALRYVAGVEPACASKHLRVCSGPCAWPSGGPSFRLRYLRPRGGALDLR
jgi:hypothetical protein